MGKRARKRLLLGTVLTLTILGATILSSRLSPMPKSDPFYLRVNGSRTLSSVLKELQDRRVVRDSTASRLYGMIRGIRPTVLTGTYQFAPGMSLNEVFTSLRRPVRQMVRVKEGRWAKRIGRLLEEKGVTTLSEYKSLVDSPGKLADPLPFRPSNKTLEGVLYPDTYDFPPLLGAQGVVQKQVENFVNRTKKAKIQPKDWNEMLTIASLIELEASDPNDRRMISGVIQNRLKQKMRLQIDATVNYGMQLWRRLKYRDYREVDSPYNTYRVNGLPPGPICSPTIDSMKAALNPIKHDYVYYVALPDGRTIYAVNYTEHLKNVKKRRQALKDIESQKNSK